MKRTGRRCKTCKQPSELPWKGRHASILRVSPLPSKYRDAFGGMPSGVREERGADASSEAIRPSNCTLNKTSSACCEAVNRYMHAVPRSLLECKAAKGLHAHSQQRPLWPRLGPPRASASSWCLAGSIAWLPTGTCGSVPSERPIAMIIAKVATRLTAGPPLLRPAAHKPHTRHRSGRPRAGHGRRRDQRRHRLYLVGRSGSWPAERGLGRPRAERPAPRLSYTTARAAGATATSVLYCTPATASPTFTATALPRLVSYGSHPCGLHPLAPILSLLLLQFNTRLLTYTFFSSSRALAWKRRALVERCRPATIFTFLPCSSFVCKNITALVFQPTSETQKHVTRLIASCIQLQYSADRVLVHKSSQSACSPTAVNRL